MPNYGDEINYTVAVMSPDDDELLGDFDCGNEIMNDYFNSKCKNDTDCVTYIFKQDDTNKIIGFASLCCSSIKYEYQKVSQSLPSIEIKYFAILAELQKLVYDTKDKHFYFSDMMLVEVIKICRNISDNIIGAQYILLYSVPNALKFYKRNGFENYSEYMIKDNIRF